MRHVGEFRQGELIEGILEDPSGGSCVSDHRGGGFFPSLVEVRPVPVELIGDEAA